MQHRAVKNNERQTKEVATLTFDDYQTATRSTAQNNKGRTKHERTRHLALGLAGETGEISDLIKKVYYHGRPMALEHLASELGDSLWYLTQIADVSGLRIGETTEGYDAFDDFQEQIMAESKPQMYDSTEDNVVYLTMSISIASAQIIHAIRDGDFHDEIHDNGELSSLISTTLSAFALLAGLHDLKMSNIARLNLEKLSRRYPRGFDAESERQRQMKLVEARAQTP